MHRHEHTGSEDIADIIAEAQSGLASEILADAMRIISAFPKSRFVFRHDGPEYPRVSLGHVCIWIAPIASRDSAGAFLYLVEIEGRSGKRPFITDQIDVAIARARRTETILRRGALRRFQTALEAGEDAPIIKHHIHLKKLNDCVGVSETAAGPLHTRVSSRNAEEFFRRQNRS